MLAHKLNPMSTAPKNECLLLDVGDEDLVVGHYSPADFHWVYTIKLEDEGQVFFINSEDSTPIGWLPIPQIKRNK